MPHPDFESLKEKLKTTPVSFEQVLQEFDRHTDYFDLIQHAESLGKPFSEEDKKVCIEDGVDPDVEEKSAQLEAESIRQAASDFRHAMYLCCVEDALKALLYVYDNQTPFQNIDLQRIITTLEKNLHQTSNILKEDISTEAVIREVIEYIVIVMTKRLMQETPQHILQLRLNGSLAAQISTHIRGNLLRSARLTP